MKHSEIAVGRWYETKLGVGKCVDASRSHPPSVRIHIVAPIPRGVMTVAPRDVLKEVDDPTLKRV